MTPELTDDEVIDLVHAAADTNGGIIGNLAWQRNFASLVRQRTVASLLASTTSSVELTRDRFYSELMALLAEHHCSSWAPRCKHCDRQEEAKARLLSWFDSKTAALGLANEQRQRLLDKLRDIGDLADVWRERSITIRGEGSASSLAVSTATAVFDTCAAALDAKCSVRTELGVRP